MVDTITWGVIGINDISVIWLEITANINLADTYLANPTNFNGMQMQDLGNRMSEFCDNKGLDWSQMPYTLLLGILSNRFNSSITQLRASPVYLPFIFTPSNFFFLN